MKNPDYEFNIDLFPIMCGTECRIYCSNSDGTVLNATVTLFKVDDKGCSCFGSKVLMPGDSFVSFPDIEAGRFLISIEYMVSGEGLLGAEQEIIVDDRQRLAMV